LLIAFSASSLAALLRNEYIASISLFAAVLTAFVIYLLSFRGVFKKNQALITMLKETEDKHLGGIE
jgi:hypothetical protein